MSMDAIRRLLICECEEARLPLAERLDALAAAAEAAGASVLRVPDFCRLVALAPDWVRAALAPGDTAVAACHARAVRGLLAGLGLADDAVTLLNLRPDADPVAPRFEADASHLPPWPPPPDLPATAPAWFPVIDRARCRDCGQCQSFCLFGVYSRDAEGHVRVTEPLSCKPNCPACARICPDAALMFPKLAEAPINGAPVADDPAAQPNVRVPMERLLGENPYAALAARRLKAEEIRRRRAAEAATGERPA